MEMSGFFEKATWWVEILIFLAFITIFSIRLVRKQSAQNFVTLYLISITIKIVLSCGFVATFILLDKPAANYNVVFFIAGYVIFTAAEVIFLLLKKRT